MELGLETFTDRFSFQTMNTLVENASLISIPSEPTGLSGNAFCALLH